MRGKIKSDFSLHSKYKCQPSLGFFTNEQPISIAGEEDGNGTG
jgi:hypothetical protein